MKLVTHNFWLKVIALALAVVLYYTLKTNTNQLNPTNDRTESQQK